MQSVMCRQSDTIKPNQIQLRSGLPVSNASRSISSMSSKSEILLVTLLIVLVKHPYRGIVVKPRHLDNPPARVRSMTERAALQISSATRASGETNFGVNHGKNPIKSCVTRI